MRTLIASFLVAFGTAKVLAQAFLLNWERLSAGQSDIAARGVWLLAGFLPEITIASAAVGVGMVWAFNRGNGRRWWHPLATGAVGSMLGGLAIFFGIDPTVILLRQLPGSAWVYYITSLGVGIVVLMGGLAILRRHRRGTPIQTAAA
jgi:hypothetical protein